jgi:hypothetical protein
MRVTLCPLAKRIERSGSISNRDWMRINANIFPRIARMIADTKQSFSSAC